MMVPKGPRCRAGIDNFGICLDINHTAFHTANQAEHCLNYRYDRCRRVAGHAKDKGLYMPDAHVLDCGGLFYDNGESNFAYEWTQIAALIDESEGLFK